MKTNANPVNTANNLINLLDRVKPSNRSLIPSHRLKIINSWIRMESLMVCVQDSKTDRAEVLCITPAGGIRHVPRIESVRTMIQLYVKYDLLSQEQFICLTEFGKQNYLSIMKDGFYPNQCLVWMNDLIKFISRGIPPEMEAIKYNPIKSLHKSIQKWAQKERIKQM